MSMETKHKVILITGGSGSIGSEITKKFTGLGHSVIINYYKSKNVAIDLEAKLISQFGKDSAFAVEADISKRMEVNKMFDETEKEFGTPDVLINCAGINRDKPFLDMNEEEWTSVISTILSGTFYCSQEFALRYKGDCGNIVNIGALTAIRGRKNGANYCSARAGVVNLTKCMALELAPKIRVNCVTPGWINTEEVMNRYHLHDKAIYESTLKTIPMARLGTPVDVADLINFLVNGSNYITGQNYLVDGGMLMY